MFTIIGGDGKEYGPATIEQIRSWINAGRANLETKAKAVGSEEWRRLGDYAEFGESRAAIPPPVSGAAPAARAEHQLADAGIRLLAWLLDQVFSMIATAPGAMMIGVSALSNILRHPESAQVEMGEKTALGIVLLFLGGAILLVVQIWLLTTRGQTLGKRIFGIRIVNVNTDANPGFVSAVLLRALVPGLITTFIPVFGFLFFIVDSCFIFRADRRCIHDLIASTRVVKV